MTVLRALGNLAGWALVLAAAWANDRVDYRALRRRQCIRHGYNCWGATER